jgi:hypothetical protein
MSGLNRDQINKLIFDNELFHGVLTGMGVVMDIEHLEKFVALVAAAEREACAEVAEKHFTYYGYQYIADDIRSRGQE